MIIERDIGDSFEFSSSLIAVVMGDIQRDLTPGFRTIELTSKDGPVSLSSFNLQALVEWAAGKSH